ncbi:4-aminobutyrate--2-oxoglutarate transaminase [Comamonas endophytica]|uniref:4-aminobutyrate--2-oxoglutarate transaminase n=1 Tax=Comamonas endophytica TaxID=2949090 RepID=A0ABY6G9L1_9BURK|nr:MULTISPECIES: 4-aminobutyrate--2-oxoglutarate transaminase [unclassified Acidovorax]MCD2514502.1 4-aminobutyrate--2-oxoglutarate transaminase [Acidovorax sp. D4N7]UYG51082.1 4-aminobutyrate--2-oxoglutarate transaminase [Acidovorax sp. 5MLIR]
MNNQQINQRRLDATPRGVGVMCNFYADRAENATIWDVEGRQYTDFAAGIAVVNTGHRHPKIVAAVQAQLERFTHTAFQIVPYESAVALAERINALAPIDGPKKTAFFTTGAEAVENAIKIARVSTGRPGVIAFGGGFHGRTMMGLALTGKVQPYKAGFGPFPGEVYHLPFPAPLRGVTVQDSLDALEHLFKCDVDPARVAAIIVEPVQGEGGFNVADAALFASLRQVCDKHGILLIADEVQTGFGRTGKLFAMEHYPTRPDIMTMAKSLAGGMPLSAVCGRAEVMDAANPGGLGGTYAGNPLAVAAAHAVIDVIEQEQLLARSVALGARLQEFLSGLSERVPAIAEVRGLGSMVAMECVDPETRAPDSALVGRIQKEALERGLLLLSCGQYGNVIRFLYPLTIPDAQFDAALQTLEEAVGAAAGVAVAA